MKKVIFYLFLSVVFFGLRSQKMVLADGAEIAEEEQSKCRDLIQGKGFLNENDFLRMSAGEVFIHFAKDQLSDNELKSTMGVHWESKTHQALDGWSAH